MTNLLGNERSRGRAAWPLVQSTAARCVSDGRGYRIYRLRGCGVSAHVWSPALLLDEADRPAHGGQRGATRSLPPERAAGLQRLLVACRGMRRAARSLPPIGARVAQDAAAELEITAVTHPQCSWKLLKKRLPSTQKLHRRTLKDPYPSHDKQPLPNGMYATLVWRQGAVCRARGTWARGSKAVRKLTEPSLHVHGCAVLNYPSD